MRKNGKSAKYSKIKIHRNIRDQLKKILSPTVLNDTLQQFVLNTFLTAVLATTSVVLWRSVEDLQYTLADFYRVIVDCLDSCLPSFPGNLLKASACRSFRRSISSARPPKLSRSMRVTIIVAFNEGNNHPFIANGCMFK